jgi:putative transport protein
MGWIAAALRAHPELAMFLVVALGHALGRVRIGPVRLNVVIGVLLAGVVVGQILVHRRLHRHGLPLAAP